MDYIPIELIERIALFMDLRSLGRFTTTSHTNSAILNSLLFWKSYFAINYSRCDPLRDLKYYCRIMPAMWTDNAAGVILQVEETAIMSSDGLSYKTLAYDRSNRFGVLGGHGSPLMSFRVTEDLNLMPLDQYTLPDTFRMLTPSRICLDDRFIVVLESTGNIVIFNKHTGELFSEIENEMEESPFYATEPSTELYFDKDQIFCAKDGVIQMWDFETGQKKNELVTEFYGACHYDNKSGLCFLGDGTRISARDMRMPLTKKSNGWNLGNNYEPISSLKCYANTLYCGTSNGVPVALDMRQSEKVKRKPVSIYQIANRRASNKVTTHVDEYRVIMGTDSQIAIYDRYKMKKSFSFKNLNSKGDVRNYSFQDSYMLVDTNTSTTLYSVTDVLYRN